MVFLTGILENLPLLGKVVSGVSPLVVGLYGIQMFKDRLDFEKEKGFKEKKIEVDRKLFEKLKKVFPISINYIKGNSKTKCFPEAGLNEFSNFCYDWDNSENLFLEKKIEEEKEVLRKVICEFKNLLLENMELRGSNYVLLQMPNDLKYQEVMEEIEQSSINLFESYQNFIVNTNRKLIL